ncbi:unnamed protein product [Amaranthus hypochondriacus]
MVSSFLVYAGSLVFFLWCCFWVSTGLGVDDQAFVFSCRFAAVLTNGKDLGLMVLVTAWAGLFVFYGVFSHGFSFLTVSSSRVSGVGSWGAWLYSGVSSSGFSF